MKVRYTRRALRDLGRIEAHVRRESPKGAVRIGARIRKRIDDLQQFPKQAKQGEGSKLRMLVVTRTPYIVVYRVRLEVEIIAIVHAAQRRRS